jgi:hypothetical protein
MKCTRPLVTTHPELLIVEGNGYCEYRVHNTYTARDGTGKTINQCSGWSWLDALVVASIAVLWPQVYHHVVASFEAYIVIIRLCAVTSLSLPCCWLLSFSFIVESLKSSMV